MLRELFAKLKQGEPFTVETGKTLFCENWVYYEETSLGRKKISREEALAHLRLFIARVRRERHEQRKQEEKTQ